MRVLNDFREMKLSRWMGFLSFALTETLIVIAFIVCECREVVSVLTLQVGLCTVVWGAVFGKNIIARYPKHDDEGVI